MVYYRQNPEGYEVRTCPLSYHPPRVTLKGKYNFDFSMGLPFVQERVRPLVRAGGGMLVRQGKGWRFRSAKSVAGLAQGGIQLTRLHNDGPWPDGIFWRDGAYPPYPPRRMKEMDQCIREFHRHGMKVVPYFSLHEFHPEVPAFAKQAKNWQRTVDDAAMMIHNTTRIGEFGAQMCLASGWGEFRKKTIDVVLKNHDFDGIYYDWTMAMPCLNKGHHPRAHWDVEAFIDLLEWTRERVGPDGVMYLHMSAVPFAIAQNLANDILTFEEFSPLKVNPDMFPAASQYMKTCMEGVIPMAEGGKQPKLFALCALLNHVSPEFHDPGILKFLTKVRTIDFTRFKKFENHRTQAVRTSKPGIRAAIYWNEEEAMVLLANLTPERQPFSWKLDPRRLGWTGGYRVAGAGCRELGPLAFKYVTVRRSASWKD
jgi:hypothetical protein